MKLKVQDKNLFSLLLLAAPLAGFLASVYFMLEDRRLIGILCWLLVGGICLGLFIFLLRAFIFVLKVDGEYLRGRNRNGKRYEFQCKDIQKITYHERYGGPQAALFTIKIKAADVEICVDNNMKNFSKLAEYLLRQREVGVLSKSAIAPFYLKKIAAVADGSYNQRRLYLKEKKKN